MARRPWPTFLRRLSQASSDPPKIFDLHAKSLQKARAAVSPTVQEYDYLRDEVAALVTDRLHDISRPFPHALDLFCGSSAHLLRATLKAENPAQIESLTHADLHPAILTRASTFYDGSLSTPDRQFVLPSEHASIPLEPGSLDLVLSAGALHWVNDLPLLFRRVRDLLRPDGLFLAAMFGGETLHELRIALQLAEDEKRARLAPRVSPMVRLRDAAGLLSGAGLALPTADVDKIVVPFTDMFAVMRHLRGMGETNALTTREIYYGRDVFQRASEIYEERFGFVDPEGRKCVPATFEIVHMIGWAPAATQRRAAQRGSAQFSLTDLPGAVETITPGSKGDSARNSPSG